MSANYTENYKLCQWEPGDKVLRTDFNEDNAKIEAALTANRSAIEQVKAIAGAAYCPDYKPVATGAYEGDGQASRFIALGFAPAAVFVFSMDGIFSNGEGSSFTLKTGMATRGISGGANQCGCVEVVSGGFRVANMKQDGRTYDLNRENETYIYFAVR